MNQCYQNLENREKKKETKNETNTRTTCLYAHSCIKMRAAHACIVRMCIWK